MSIARQCAEFNMKQISGARAVYNPRFPSVIIREHHATSAQIDVNCGNFSFVRSPSASSIGKSNRVAHKLGRLQQAGFMDAALIGRTRGGVDPLDQSSHFQFRPGVSHQKGSVSLSLYLSIRIDRRIEHVFSKQPFNERL